MKLRTRIMNFLEKLLGPPSSAFRDWMESAQFVTAQAVQQSFIQQLKSQILTDKMDRVKVRELLESVLCDPEGEISLGPTWSIGDLQVVKEALDLLRGKRKGGGEITVDVDPKQSATTREQITKLNQSICLHRTVQAIMPGDKMKCVACDAVIDTIFRCEAGESGVVGNPCEHKYVSAIPKTDQAKCNKCGYRRPMTNEELKILEWAKGADR